MQIGGREEGPWVHAGASRDVQAGGPAALGSQELPADPTARSGAVPSDWQEPTACLYT